MYQATSSVQSADIAHIKFSWLCVTLSIASFKSHNKNCSNTSFQSTSNDERPLILLSYRARIIWIGIPLENELPLLSPNIARDKRFELIKLGG